MNQSPEKLEYIAGLDGLRALAALLVISTHWPGNQLSLKFGWIGVNIFFVLSGFLITRILVNEKYRSFKSYLNSFFYKRAIRIFPIYYLFLFITALFILLAYWFVPQLAHNAMLLAGVHALQHDMPAYFTYTTNLKFNLAYFFNWHDPSNQFFGHVWSLAVEEQFYLIFPFIVYFTNPRPLKKILIAILVICPLLRLLAATIGIHFIKDTSWLGQFFYTNTFCQADALATGALLALVPIKIKYRYLPFLLSVITFLMVGLTCLFFLRKAGYFLVEGKSLGFNYPGFWFNDPTPWFLVNIRAFYQYTLVNILAAALIAPAIIKKPLFPFLFQSKPVIHLGKISYGIYLFHVPVLAFFTIAGDFWFGHFYYLTDKPLVGIGVFIIYLITVFSLAHLSFKYFEQKISNKFRYKLNNGGN